MIRKLQKKDIDDVAEIWLDTNISAHEFVPAQYWRDHFELVKEMFLQAEMYVYEDEQSILGFVGLSENYIAGIFVRQSAQSQGIGKKLLDYVKENRKQLSLNVYEKNVRAVKFYKKEGFVIESTGTDSDTGEKEYTMSWKDE